MQCSPADSDLGVLVDGKFNMCQQFDLAAKRANPCVGCCKHGIDHRSKGVIGLLCSLLMQHHVYAVKASTT